MVRNSGLQTLTEATLPAILKRLEKLANNLLKHEFSSVDQLWQFELDLLDLQRDIQLAVNKAKVAFRRKEIDFTVLSQLRSSRWDAKRLGDSFAWIVLRGNRRIIEPLARNESSAVLADNHGSRGMLLIASHLAREGWGFPLIHDITDMLRIGDITFIKTNENSQRTHSTVEVKTKVEVTNHLVDQGLTEHRYRITVILPAPLDPDTGEQANPVRIDEATVNSSDSISITPTAPRTVRQTNRMATALLEQTTDSDVLLRREGKPPALWTQVHASPTSHWTSLQQVVRKARRTGYGSACVDNALVYAAFYNANGISAKDVQLPQFKADILESSIVARDGTVSNVLRIFEIPPSSTPKAQPSRPFYLYPIPRSSIFDILNGRMAVVVCLSEGRIVQALERAGYEVAIKIKGKMRAISITRPVTASSGDSFIVHHPDVGQYINEMVYEFRGVDHVIHAADAMVKATTNAFASEISRQSD